jgi:hypothetical protein
MPADEQIETPEPMADDELEAKLSKFSPAEACNLKVLYFKYLQGQTQKWQEEKLIACGIIGGRVKSAAEMPTECSQTQMAAHLTETYGKSVGREYFTGQISSWIKNEGAPGPGANRRLNTADFIKWFLENKFEGGGAAITGESSTAKGATAKNERQVVALERERFQLEAEKKKAAKELVSRREAELACIGLAKRFLAITREEIRYAFLKTDVARGEALIDELDKKYKEAASEIQESEVDVE